MGLILYLYSLGSEVTIKMTHVFKVYVPVQIVPYNIYLTHIRFDECLEMFHNMSWWPLQVHFSQSPFRILLEQPPKNLEIPNDELLPTEHNPQPRLSPNLPPCWVDLELNLLDNVKILWHNFNNLRFNSHSIHFGKMSKKITWITITCWKNATSVVTHARMRLTKNVSQLKFYLRLTVHFLEKSAALEIMANFDIAFKWFLITICRTVIIFFAFWVFLTFGSVTVKYSTLKLYHHLNLSKSKNRFWIEKRENIQNRHFHWKIMFYITVHFFTF